MSGKINASLNEKLKNVEWGEYRIGDLFCKLSGKKAKASEVRKYKNSEFCVPVVYCKFGDNGIMYWGRKNEFKTYENVISIIYNGAIATGKVYAQKEETGILAESYFIKLKAYEPSHNLNLFLASVLEKVLYNKYSREFLATWDHKVENDKIVLPTKNGKLDFCFMEQFIAELEAQRVAELEAYLKVTGLDNYELTLDEINSLNCFNEVEWGEYRVDELFEICSYKKRFDANKVKVLEEGDYPYVVRMSRNNGQKGYINENTSYLNQGNTISFGQDTATMFYQEKPYFTGDKIKVLKPKYNDFNKNNAQFIISALRKSFSLFSWGGSSFNVDIISEQLVRLPKKNSEIDFQFMDKIVKIIQKLIIKDVVQYADRKIDATKTIVKKN